MISVLMSVYNGEKTVARAVRSILGGTFSDFEFIIVDDGSTDGTYAVAEQLARGDGRIKLHRNKHNAGLAASLNHALKQAKGDYIARMDADDVSYPGRLDAELKYLFSHPELDFAGSAARLITPTGEEWGVRRFPEKVDRDTVLKYNPFIHPTLLFKKSALLAVNGYRDIANTVRCEDYDLIFRLYAKGFLGGNTDEILLDYTEDTDSARRHSKATRRNEYTVRKEGSRALHGGIKGFAYSLKPLVLSLLSDKAYNRMHNGKWQNKH